MPRLRTRGAVPLLPICLLMVCVGTALFYFVSLCKIQGEYSELSIVQLHLGEGDATDKLMWSNHSVFIFVASLLVSGVYSSGYGVPN